VLLLFAWGYDDCERLAALEVITHHARLGETELLEDEARVTFDLGPMPRNSVGREAHRAYRVINHTIETPIIMAIRRAI
jgi:hypothetical protein